MCHTVVVVEFATTHIRIELPCVLRFCVSRRIWSVIPIVDVAAYFFFVLLPLATKHRTQITKLPLSSSHTVTTWSLAPSALSPTHSLLAFALNSK